MHKFLHVLGDALVLDIHRVRLARRRHFPFGALVEPRRARPQAQLGLALLAPVLRKVLHARASDMSAHADHVADESTGREGHGGPPVVRDRCFTSVSEPRHEAVGHKGGKDHTSNQPLELA